MADEYNKYPMLNNCNENRAILQEDTCDKYDYVAAIACGAIGGIIDIFFVGAPDSSALGNWTDKQVDNTVMAFSKKMGWNPKEKNICNVNSAIGFLERNYKVNYDQRKSGDVNNLFNIAPKTHHMMSLAHSPDLVGLFFSILNQFTSTSSFVVNGQLVTVSTDTYELRGNNFVMKIMCGIANWLGHLMSDVSGSSGSHGRGMGIVIPFYEFFGFCKFGGFQTKEGPKDLAEIAMQAFTQGYDFRFGLAQAISVIITELSIRLIWALRRRFQYQKPIKECIPTVQHADLRVMLLLGNGTLCLMDGIGAGLCSHGNALTFFMRLNLIAWFRLVMLVLKEVFIRVGLSNALQKNIEAFKRINEALLFYLKELEKIDIEQFRKETKEYNLVVKSMLNVNSEEELNILLLETFEKMGINKPWKGDFNEYMSDSNARLEFE